MMAQSTRDAQLTALAELNQLLSRDAIPYWVFGGWAVDFHIGEPTRAHGDIDIAIWADDQSHLAALLGAARWRHSPEAGEDGYTCYRRGSVRLEVAFLARDADGVIYTPTRAGRGEWPVGSFGDTVATLLGVQARVVTRQSLIDDKSQPRDDAHTAAKDRADVLRLRE
jgi:hypothetical protein